MLHVMQQVYSARFPHFSMEPLQASLKAANIGYVFLGLELGARRDEPECYVDGQALYDRIAALPARLEQAYARRARAIAYRRTAPAASAAK